MQELSSGHSIGSPSANSESCIRGSERTSTNRRSPSVLTSSEGMDIDYGPYLFKPAPDLVHQGHKPNVLLHYTSIARGVGHQPTAPDLLGTVGTGARRVLGRTSIWSSAIRSSSWSMLPSFAARNAARAFA